MRDDGFRRLTDEQREVLRLVMLRLTAKEIAPRLGITPSAVEGRLKTARHVLGAGSSAEAARLLFAHERSNRDQSTIYGPSELADDRRTAEISATDEGLELGAAPMDGKSASLDRLSDQATTGRSERTFPWPFPSVEGQRNDLSLGWRLAWPFVILIGLMIATGLLLNSIATLSQLARAIVHGR